MNRRALLGHAAAILGASISAPLLAGVLGGCKPTPEGKPGAALSVAQQELVAALAETIIPETKTPGARSANVHGFIDMMLANWYADEDRTRFLDGLAALETQAAREQGMPFLKLSAEKRLAFLETLDREAIDARKKAQNPLPFFAMLKELTIVGYYTSKQGMAAIGYQGPIGATFGELGPIGNSVWI